MKNCCVCGSFVVPVNNGIDHIAFQLIGSRRDRYICQSCLNAILNQLEYGHSVKYDYAGC